MIQEFVAQVNKAARNAMEGMHTAMPGEFTAYDPDTGMARVRPKVKFVRPDGGTMDYPEITDVPVVFPQSEHVTVAFPIHKGDGCLIIFAEKALDYWRYGQETQTRLSFDLTNAIAIPSVRPAGSPIMKLACEEDAAVIASGGTMMKIKSDGVTVIGDLTVEGKITATGDVVASGSVSLAGHTHSTNDGMTGRPR